MKVLFAVSNEKISDSIAKKYQQEYKEIISSKNVYYFNAIIKELQKDKSYDRIVISEDLEMFSSNNYQEIDKFIFDKLDNISDEAVNTSGGDIPIILICTDRRTKMDPLMIKLFGIGVYSALLGQDRSIQKVCDLIYKPRGKKEAKAYYRVESDNVDYKTETATTGVSEIELQSILAHYRKIVDNPKKCVESFRKIVAQYTEEQLKIILSVLPFEIKQILEVNSEEYAKITGIAVKQKKSINQLNDNNIRQEYVEKDISRTKMANPVIIPTQMDTTKIRKIGQGIANSAESVVARQAAIEKNKRIAERKAAEERARKIAEKKVAEEKAKRKAAEEKARIEAEQKVAEEKAKREAERKAAEERAKKSAERKAAQEKARIEAERRAAEERAKKIAERKAAEERAKKLAERKAAQEKARIEAERKAAQEKARIEAERKAAQEKARIEAERKAAQERAKKEAEKKAAQEKARKEAERKAAQEKARIEAERKAAQEKARKEAERKAAQEKARKEAERKATIEKATKEKNKKILGEGLENMEEQAKRRGRPRKNIVDEPIISIEPKKGRGRPRKNIVDEPIISTEPKRGRGRPRKDIDDKFDDMQEENIFKTTVSDDEFFDFEEFEDLNNKKNKEANEVSEKYKNLNKTEDADEELPIDDEDYEEIDEEEIEDDYEDADEELPIDDEDYEEIDDEEVEDDYEDADEELPLDDEDYEEIDDEEIEDDYEDADEELPLDDEDYEEIDEEEIEDDYEDADEELPIDDEDYEEIDDEEIEDDYEDADEELPIDDEDYEEIDDEEIEDDYEDADEELPLDDEDYEEIDDEEIEDSENELPLDEETMPEEDDINIDDEVVLNSQLPDYSDDDNDTEDLKQKNEQEDDDELNEDDLFGDDDEDLFEDDDSEDVMPIEEDDDDMVQKIMSQSDIGEIQNKNLGRSKSISAQNLNMDIEENDIQENVEAKEIENVNNKPDLAIDNLITGDRKVVSFVGTSKNGTSFIINNLAKMFSEKGIKTAILDLTQNRNAYYIYTENEEELRKTAFTCLENLNKGIAEGIQVNKNLTVYTSLPGETESLRNGNNIIETLLKEYSLILLDCDFNTDAFYFKVSQEMYLVQSLDVLTIQPLTAFLRELKVKNILEPEKLRIILNKMIKVNGITDRILIGGMSVYNDPGMTYMTELFDRTKIKYATIPFESQIYANYLESLAKCKISYKGCSKNFLASLNSLGNMVYPLLNGKYNKKDKSFNNFDNNFSADINNTLNKMKSKF